MIFAASYNKFLYDVDNFVDPICFLHHTLKQFFATKIQHLQFYSKYFEEALLVLPAIFHQFNLICFQTQNQFKLTYFFYEVFDKFVVKKYHLICSVLLVHIFLQERNETAIVRDTGSPHTRRFRPVRQRRKIEAITHPCIHLDKLLQLTHAHSKTVQSSWLVQCLKYHNMLALDGRPSLAEMWIVPLGMYIYIYIASPI